MPVEVWKIHSPPLSNIINMTINVNTDSMNRISSYAKSREPTQKKKQQTWNYYWGKCVGCLLLTALSHRSNGQLVRQCNTRWSNAHRDGFAQCVFVSREYRQIDERVYHARCSCTLFTVERPLQTNECIQTMRTEKSIERYIGRHKTNKRPPENRRQYECVFVWLTRKKKEWWRKR